MSDQDSKAVVESSRGNCMKVAYRVMSQLRLDVLLI